jgi:hypothetical protein
MKQILAVAIVVLSAVPAYARPVRIWSYEELFKESDVVAIVRVNKIEDTTTKLDGYARLQGKRATLKVGLNLKGERQQVLYLDFFSYPTGINGNMVPNGFYFVNFGRADKADYLVFLKKTADGTLISVSGQYDAGVSIREVTPGLIRAEDEPTKKPAAPLISPEVPGR